MVLFYPCDNEFEVQSPKFKNSICTKKDETNDNEKKTKGIWVNEVEEMPNEFKVIPTVPIM